MGLDERGIAVILLLAIFLYHYIKLSLRVRRIEKGVIYAVSLDKGLMTAVSFANRNLDGSLDYQTDFFSSGHVYSLSDAKEILGVEIGVYNNRCYNFLYRTF